MGIEVAVAITRLAKHGAIVSLLVRFVKHYIRYLFACQPVGTALFGRT
jgi:hypothetical protein